MNPQLLLEEKRAVLKNELSENLQKKHILELKINEQFEQLKRMEISLERRARTSAAEE
jgi:hypothetical protein